MDSLRIHNTHGKTVVLEEESISHSKKAQRSKLLVVVL